MLGEEACNRDVAFGTRSVPLTLDQAGVSIRPLDFIVCENDISGMDDGIYFTFEVTNTTDKELTIETGFVAMDKVVIRPAECYTGVQPNSTAIGYIPLETNLMPVYASSDLRNLGCLEFSVTVCTSEYEYLYTRDSLKFDARLETSLYSEEKIPEFEGTEVFNNYGVVATTTGVVENEVGTYYVYWVKNNTTTDIVFSQCGSTVNGVDAPGVGMICYTYPGYYTLASVYISDMKDSDISSLISTVRIEDSNQMYGVEDITIK